MKDNRLIIETIQCAQMRVETELSILDDLLGDLDSMEHYELMLELQQQELPIPASVYLKDGKAVF